ncbi:TonB-dependent receptor [Ekhidna sp.]
MKHIFRHYLGYFLILISASLYAQKGIIRGTVIEDTTGEPLIGVTVVIKGTTNGAVTDFDGKFQINAAPGTYDIQASFVSFSTITINGVSVEDGDATVIDQIRLKEDVELLDEVVVTAEVIKTTEAALLTVKRKSASLVDGISSANFKKIGDSDAASAVKRVTGVSIEGGKYVYVRGIGDRYTKTMLNSMDIPGLDPDRNSLQIDIFPTNLIDNMIVYKTATADLPADFTGGVVNIETKDFPDEKILEASFGMTFNPSMHLQSDYLTHEGSSTDWLGFDNGLRDLPEGARNEEIPSPLSRQYTDEQILDFNNSFNKQLGAQQERSFLDYSLGFNLGDQKELNNGHKLGYILSTTYKSTTTFFDNVVYGEYQIQEGRETSTELIPATIQTGTESRLNTLIGGLAGIAYKTNNSKFRVNLMHLQNGERLTAKFAILDDPEDQAIGKSGFSGNADNLVYGQRGLTNVLVNGEHHFNDNNWILDWKFSPTFSNMTDPDIRKAAFTNEGGDKTINGGAAGFPTRIWRYLDEVNYSSRVDLTRNATAFGGEATFKFGISHTYKERDYEILQYQFQFFGGQPDWTGDPDEILLEENLFPNDGNGYLQSGNRTPNPNAYNSNVNYSAAYLSAEVTPLSNLKAIVGLRVEKFEQRHTGRDISFAQSNGNAGNNLDNDVVLDNTDLFPSANLIYNLTDRQNLRFSVSRTVARPSFKELSFAQILDPVSNRTFNGGLFAYEGEWDGNLQATNISNFDLRWEKFMDRGQLLSFSAFYKTFSNPIELVRIRQAQTTNEFQPRNVGDGTLIGAELELRKTLDFITPGLTNFSWITNVTLVKTKLEMSNVEFQARTDFGKAGQEITNEREMAGQAPYVINAGIAYENFETRIDAGLYYNVQGKTLTVVGGGLFPDVYSQPFNSLNLNINKRFGAQDNVGVNFSVNNILNDDREEFYNGHNAEPQFFSRRSPGRSFSVGVNYSF